MLTPAVSDGRPATLTELHAQLATQAKDPSWSFDTEQSIRQSLAAGNASAEFDIVNVECRASLCEVLAFGNLPSSGERWNQVWDGMSKQSWYAGIKGNSTSSLVQNGRYTITTILHRAKP